MPHVFYDINKVIGLIENQRGAGNFEGFLYQRGTRHLQRGRGVMGLIGKAWRYLVPKAKAFIKPLAKSALKALAEEGLEAGSNVLSGIARGEDPRDTVVTEGTQALKNLMKRTGTKLAQAGSGRRKPKRKPIRPKKPSLADLHVVGRSALENSLNKKLRAKNLGLY